MVYSWVREEVFLKMFGGLNMYVNVIGYIWNILIEFRVGIFFVVMLFKGLVI